MIFRALILFLTLLSTAHAVHAVVPFPFAFWKPELRSPIPELLWWKLNEGSGTAMADSSIGGANGTNDAAWVIGQSGSGSSLDFDGTADDSSTSAAVTYGTNIVTVTFWLFADSTNTTQMIFEVGDPDFSAFDHTFASYLSTSGIVGSVRGTGVPTNYRVEAYGIVGLSAWNHWVIVCDNSSTAGNVRIFKNAAEVTTTLASNTKAGSGNFIATQRLYVGARASTSLFLNGRLDDFRVYTGDKSSEAAKIMTDSQ